mgnify:CR=1 FL=1
MKDFFALLDKLNESDRKQVEGYSLAEIKRIEKLYDITIQGDFLEFMLKIGRCSGGLFGDDPIILYKEQRSVRSQILFQLITIMRCARSSHFVFHGNQRHNIYSY